MKLFWSSSCWSSWLEWWIGAVWLSGGRYISNHSCNGVEDRGTSRIAWSCNSVEWPLFAPIHLFHEQMYTIKVGNEWFTCDQNQMYVNVEPIGHVKLTLSAHLQKPDSHFVHISVFRMVVNFCYVSDLAGCTGVKLAEFPSSWLAPTLL